MYSKQLQYKEELILFQPSDVGHSEDRMCCADPGSIVGMGVEMSNPAAGAQYIKDMLRSPLISSVIQLLKHPSDTV
ncbi:unnamed protein product [Arctogadus glacialis]